MKTDAFVPPDMVDTMVSIPAVMLIVNWNCVVASAGCSGRKELLMRLPVGISSRRR